MVELTIKVEVSIEARLPNRRRKHSESVAIRESTYTNESNNGDVVVC